MFVLTNDDDARLLKPDDDDENEVERDGVAPKPALDLRTAGLLVVAGNVEAELGTDCSSALQIQSLTSRKMRVEGPVRRRMEKTVGLMVSRFGSGAGETEGLGDEGSRADAGQR